MSAVETTPRAASHNIATSRTTGDTTPSNAKKLSPTDTKASVKNKLLGLVKKGGRSDAKSEGEQGVGSKERSPNIGQANTTAKAQPMAASHSGTAPGRSPSPNQSLTAASSMIFERNVQERSSLSLDATPAIPAHIMTEDQIPPALEASSLAITDSHLGPEEVEIVTHAAHQPAAAIIAESIPSNFASETSLPLSPNDLSHDHMASPTHHDGDDATSNYGALDPNDVRRLSFISFADVVHGEHAETGSIHSSHHTPFVSGTDVSQSQSPNPNRPSSPAMSPLSNLSQPFSHGVSTPLTSASGPGSAKGVELSPVRSANTSPLAASPASHSELSIETLGQALRKTASRDLSGFNRSPPSSAV